MESTCKQRLPQMYKTTMGDMRRLLKSGNDSHNIHDWEQTYSELVLNWEYNTQFKSLTLMLSWGGPADGFLFSPKGRNVKYYFQDWGDYAERELTGVDLKTMRALFKLLPQPTV